MARTLGSAALLSVAAALSLAGDVVVLRGGVKIELKAPWVQQGNMALLTRADGRLLSVAVSEIDLKATAAAKAKPSPARPAPAILANPETPAEAVRLGREGPKARVKLTDRDVGHYAEFALAPGEKKESDARAGGARLEIADYTQERAGENFIVRGAMRNVGATSALSARLTISVLDEKGQTIGSGPATLSNGSVESGASVSFMVGIPVGDKIVTQIRFAPQWIAAPPPAAEGARAQGYGMPSGTAAAAGPSPAGASQSPLPQPTPWGRGLMWAPPSPPSRFSPPPDGKTGYIPGPASPESQPKPPQ